MLLRNRSRAVTKPPLMADHSSNPSPNQNCAKTIPSLFGSPKFRDFTNKCLSAGTDALRSPTSILDTRSFIPSFGFGNPFSHDKSTQTFPLKTSETRSSMVSKGIGLALVGDFKDELVDEKNSAEPIKGSVFLGKQLRVKIPPLEYPSSFSPSKSQTHGGHDFGTKTKASQQNTATQDSPSVVVTSVLSLSEMELSEEYTCVISHGPTPRTTHIFNNSIVESYYSLPPDSPSSSSSVNFLSFCYTCKKHLEQTKDIFIYGGEKAFCSRECRHREMVLDGVECLDFEINDYF
ncbi:protein MARD1 [Lotus japonicus]|uniref:protein MARD1 n=1 Tax=Lotus japonicus TaxID=34305 RepID=UPI002583F2F0|nr:protein MARD1 [Lotus japonicus]